MMMSEDDNDDDPVLVVPLKKTYGGPTTNLKYCDGCCDTRRATIILSIVFLSLGCINLAILWGAEELKYETEEEFQDIDDDALWDILNRSYVHESIFLGVGIFSNLCSIVGAIRFSTRLVGINIAWMVIYYFASIIIEISTINELEDHFPNTIPYPWGSWIVAGLLTLIFLSPMAMFVREVNKGRFFPGDDGVLFEDQQEDDTYDTLHSLPPDFLTGNNNNIWTTADTDDELEDWEDDEDGDDNIRSKTSRGRGRSRRITRPKTSLSKFGREHQHTIVFSTK